MDLSTLRITVLGDVTATRQGTALDVGGRRQRAVLALLVLARGDAMPADRLIDSLWGQQPPAGAAGNLQSYISRLRRQLEPGAARRSRGSVIVSRGPGYALSVGPDTVDAWRFEQLMRQASANGDPAGAVTALTEALALWRGPALAEYTGEPWAQAEVNRLTELREVAGEQLLAARMEQGEAAVVVPEAEAMVAEQPLREERWRLLALALYRSHRQGDALGALRRARQVLSDELGVDPGPALRALEAEVLVQSPALQLTTLRAPATRAGASAPAPAPVQLPAAAPATGDLVDRGRELVELTGCLEEALEGQARVVFVEGPAGIGKTRLLAEARRLAADRGFRIFTARGSQLEKEYGFGAVRQLLEPTVAAATREGPAVLAGAAASAATVFDVAAAEPPYGDGSLAVLHGLYWLTVNLASDGPLIVAIDDLQWCDSASLRFLAYLVRRIEGLPILVVATLRTGEPHADQDLLAELAHDPITVSIRPAPLSVAGVTDLVRDRLGGSADDTFAAACHRTTSGNPLLVRQLLRALQSEGVRPIAAHVDTVTAIGSRAISSLVLMRLARLPRTSAAVARAVAVLGDRAALPEVSALADIAEAETVAAVAALARAEVLRDDYPLGFVHPLVADAIYRDLPPGERQLHHERAARLLDKAGAAAEQVAAHLLQVPQRGDSWVVGILRRAAATAAGRGASHAAATYLARAVAEPPDPADRADVLLELGMTEALTDIPTAIGHLREAYHLLRDPVRRATTAQMLTRTLVFGGAPGEAVTFARRAAENLPGNLLDERQGLLAVERCGGFMHDVDPAIWRRGAEPEIVGEGPGARMLAAALAWETFIDGMDRDKAVRLARFALADGILEDADPWWLWAVAAMVLHLADVDTASFWDNALARAYGQGSLSAVLTAHLWRGHQQWARGDLREAQEGVITASEQAEGWASGGYANAYGAAYGLRVLVDRGDVVGALDLLVQVSGPLPRGDGGRLLGEARAVVLTAEGRYAEALTALDEIKDWNTCVVNPAWRPWRSLRAQALAGLGRRAEAVRLVEEELVLARAWGAPSVVGRTLRLLGQLRGADGAAELREAVEALAGSIARLEYAHAMYALATHLSPGEAVPVLRQAAEIAGRCGANGLYQQIESALARAGVTLSPLAASAALTATERRILARHLDGEDERQIADALFLTTRSVRTTLHAVRERLGATSLAGLRQALDTDPAPSRLAARSPAPG
ncbi:BTAD domain-containing putative transcriptional regulator [Nonomuraea sp. NPDC049480]|uniref:BTAD domain-containing putative transcriptional regulator n=1 Tax=Nonomuraea sp. NPDC049480 TaxID=3364353 RepID=UPI0037BA6B80